MRRARHNVETLYQRLQEIGFHFEFPENAFVPPQARDLARINAFENAGGDVPLSVRAWIEEVGRVNFAGNYPNLSYYAPTNLPENFDSLLIMAESMKDKMADFGLDPGIFDQGRQLLDRERSKAVEPLNQDQIVVSDPLVVMFNLQAEAYREWKKECELEGIDDPYFFTFAPDADQKANLNGAEYEMTFLDTPAADATIDINGEELGFVEYLRHAFTWGGFPGLAEAENRAEDVLK